MWSFTSDANFKYQLASLYCNKCKLLELGCGLGYGTSLLNKNGAQIFATDYSTATIKLASKIHLHQNLSFFVSDARILGVKTRVFDVVIAIELFEHIRDSHRFIREVKRVLKENGIFIMTTPNKIFHIRDEIGLKYTDPYHINLANFQNLKKILLSYFQSIKILGIRRKKGALYNFIRSLDFLNLRLIFRENHRKLIKKKISFCKQQSINEEEQKFETKNVNFLNAHTFSSSFVICK